MPKLIMTFLATLIAFSIFDNNDGLAMDLSHYKWKNRLLFIFTPQKGDPIASSIQTEILARKGEVLERDIVVFKIFESNQSYVGNTPVDQQAAEAYREKFEIAHGGFICILVGKDGGVKLRRSASVSLSEVFALIDSMPMRQKEMRQKN